MLDVEILADDERVDTADNQEPITVIMMYLRSKAHESISGVIGGGSSGNDIDLIKPPDIQIYHRLMNNIRLVQQNIEDQMNLLPIEPYKEVTSHLLQQQLDNLGIMKQYSHEIYTIKMNMISTFNQEIQNILHIYHHERKSVVEIKISLLLTINESIENQEKQHLIGEWQIISEAFNQWIEEHPNINTTSWPLIPVCTNENDPCCLRRLQSIFDKLQQVDLESKMNNSILHKDVEYWYNFLQKFKGKCEHEQGTWTSNPLYKYYMIRKQINDECESALQCLTNKYTKLIDDFAYNLVLSNLDKITTIMQKPIAILPSLEDKITFTDQPDVFEHASKLAGYLRDLYSLHQELDKYMSTYITIYDSLRLLDVLDGRDVEPPEAPEAPEALEVLEALEAPEALEALGASE